MKKKKPFSFPPLLSFPNEIPASLMKECSPPADKGSELWLVTGEDPQLFAQEKTSSSAEYVNSSAPAIPTQTSRVPITQHLINQTPTTHTHPDQE